jgi:hypothetical protein
MAKHRPEKQSEIAEVVPSPLNAIVAENVMQVLGTPDDLQTVQVRALWSDHYRVNILAGADVNSIRVIHSYFLVTDQQGGIVDSTPKLKRLY